MLQQTRFVYHRACVGCTNHISKAIVVVLLKSQIRFVCMKLRHPSILKTEFVSCSSRSSHQLIHTQQRHRHQDPDLYLPHCSLALPRCSVKDSPSLRICRNLSGSHLVCWCDVATAKQLLGADSGFHSLNFSRRSPLATHS